MGFFNKAAGSGALGFGAFASTDKGKGLLFGKVTDPGGLPEEIKDLRNISARLQTQGIQEIEKDIRRVGSGEFKKEAADRARRITAEQTRGARSSYDDAIAALKQKIAQRGLQRSSAGLLAETGLSRQLADQISSIRAGERGLSEDIYRQERRQTIMDALSGGRGSLQASAMFKPAPRRMRGGILKPLLTVAGGAAGAIMGGPAGAGAGAQIGSSVGSLGEGAFGPS